MNSIKNQTIILLACLVAFYPSLFAQEKAPAKHFKLENGLRVFLSERHTLPLVNIVIGVNLGSKDETKETSGLVHMLEHCILFRGTEDRSGAEVSQDVRRRGSYFNAHTGQDFALFELSLPSEHLDFGLENQKEILFNLKLTQEAIDEEKQIILEEINQVKDDPLKYATSLVHQNLFPGHAYEKPIYGKKEVIEAITASQMEEFYQKYFVPANCALALVGDFEIRETEEKIKTVFGSLSNEGVSPQKFSQASPLASNVELEEEMDINLGYLVIGVVGPDYNHLDQYALDLLCEIIGSGVSPMLYLHLQSRRIQPSSITMSYSSYKYGGAVLLYITIDPGKINSAKRETIRFLKEARRQNYSQKDYLGEEQFSALDYLESARNQIRFKVHQSHERGLLLATSLVRFMLMEGDEQRGNYLENIEKVTTSDLRKAAAEYLSRGRYVVVSLVPKKKKE